MNKESIEKIKIAFRKVIENENISNEDKLELLMNIDLFLTYYEDNIRILNKYGKKRRTYDKKN